jgi:long-chain acyl-CoA synthetase
VGWPSPEYEFRLVDDLGREVRRPGEVGEIQVRGDFIMKGYWNQPEATAHAIEPSGWLHSGDLACFRPDGAVRLVGRVTEMFKSGGYNVYPQEVEQVIAAFPGATMCAVIGVPDFLYGEVGHAHVLAARGAVLSECKLREHCREHLANYKVPKKFVITSDLPTLPNGKVDKKALRNRACEKGPELREE